MRRCALIVLAAALPASAGMSWDFQTDAAGWGTLNDAREFSWDGSIGNPAGAIRARDVGDGRIWYYSAPAGAPGDLSNLYAGEISWDILGIQGNQTSIPGRADVMLFGAGLEIGIDASVVPVNGEWTSWSVGVDAAAGWELVDSTANGTLGAAASEAQIRAVLADLQGLHIRGEYTNGADRTALDNVAFVPAPGAIALVGAGGLVVCRRRR